MKRVCNNFTGIYNTPQEGFGYNTSVVSLFYFKHFATEKIAGWLLMTATCI